MQPELWRIVTLLVLIFAALVLFPRGGPGRGTRLCDRCGFVTLRGVPACPRCGQALDMTAVELNRLERACWRGELDDAEYRRRRLAVIRGEAAGPATRDGGERRDRQRGDSGRRPSRPGVQRLDG